jgi:hypothetical protein
VEATLGGVFTGMSELMAKLARRRSLNGEDTTQKVDAVLADSTVSNDETQPNDAASLDSSVDTSSEQVKLISNVPIIADDNRLSNSDKKDSNSKWYPGKYLGFKPRTEKVDTKDVSSSGDNRNSTADISSTKDDLDTNAIDKDIDDFLSSISDKESNTKSFYKRNKPSSKDNLFDDTDDNISGIVASINRDENNETLEIQNTKLKLQVANLVKEIRYKDQNILNLHNKNWNH